MQIRHHSRSLKSKVSGDRLDCMQPGPSQLSEYCVFQIVHDAQHVYSKCLLNRISSSIFLGCMASWQETTDLCKHHLHNVRIK